MTGGVIALAVAALGAVVGVAALVREAYRRALASEEARRATEVAARDDALEQLRSALADAQAASDRIAGACLDLDAETRQVAWPARPGGSAPALVARVQGEQQQASRALAAAQRAVAALVRPAEPGDQDAGAGAGSEDAARGTGTL